MRASPSAWTTWLAGWPAALALGAACAGPAAAAPGRDPAVARKVEALMARMTLEEKVGQLHQMTGEEVTGPTSGRNNSKLDDIRKGRVGAMLNVKGVADTRALQAAALQSRLKIPLLFGQDVIHGYQTVFPVPLAEAASWDMAAIEQSARVAAREASAAGIHWTFAPMVDIARDPRWGRVMEGAGEDPFLGSAIAVARVRGFQGPRLGATDAVMATAKHFAAYGAAIAGRDYNAVDMSERALLETYLPPFKAAARAGVATFMNAFNTLNGIPATGSSYLQRDILKGRWKFDGFVVSDWRSIPEMVTHGYAHDLADAAAKALTAGSDMDLEGYAYADKLAGLVRSGKVSRKLLDDAVRRVLTKKYQLGLFDDPYRFSDPERERRVLADPAHRLAARDMARKSLVLLKNEGQVLPLPGAVRTLAVIGPLADAQRDLEGGWTVHSNPQAVTSVLAALRAQLPRATQVIHAQGCAMPCTSRDGFAAAADAAARADMAVLVLGETWDMTGEAKSRAELGLPGLQEQLFDAVQASGKPVAVVIMAGRPLVFNRIADTAPAILYAWFPGTEGGNAVAEVLAGHFPPSGKLPITFPRSVGQIPITYQQYQTGRPKDNEDDVAFRSAYIDSSNTPRFAFGHGLGYTTFDYRDLAVSADRMAPDGKITVSFTLANTGRRAGDEVVQLYLRDMVASVVRPLKELKGFRKIHLGPGERRRVAFTIDREMLSFYNAKLKRVAEPGEFEVMIGGASDAIALRHRIWLTR